MKDLTEKWKKGELPSGWYYTIVKKEFSNRIDFYNSSAKIWSYNSNDVIKQVLAPVPSYEEYLESESHCAVYSEVNKSLKEENQRLKELLKKLHRDVQEIVLYSHDIEDIDQEDWFTISRRQADVANNIAKDIYYAIGADNDKK